jgi:CheY-like chemotaxis protein
VADSLALLLSHLGAETRVTYDGEAAIQVAEAFRPQLIFLDLGMPGIDGIAVARRIKRRSDGDEFKLIALTGWGQHEDRAKTREAGFDLHLTKPASVEEVSVILRETANFGAAAVAKADGNQPPTRSD